MASQSVITGADGEGKGNADLSDKNEEVSMITWLKENRLNAFIKYFQTDEAAGMTVDELLQYSDGDLELTSLIPMCPRPCVHALRRTLSVTGNSRKDARSGFSVA